MPQHRLSTEEYVAGVRAGDRRILARAITLIESRRPDDAPRAREVLQALLPDTGRSWRVGISGVPGVGKSTFLETLGNQLVGEGKRVAVLAVDPSSSISGGSILGDKTRMAELSRSKDAYIRPTPGGGALGGVAHHSREAMLLCEAAGFDVVFVETIGVGQSETAVAAMVDDFLLLMLAGAGDDLQGIKRGILELADGVVITKADGDNQHRAERAAAELQGALSILRGGDRPKVRTCSALTGAGIEEVWQALAERRSKAEADGSLQRRRRQQDLHWFDATVEELLRARFFADPRVAAALPKLRDAVRAGELAPTAAARALLDESNPG